MKKFLKITGRQLIYFKASFHFEYDDPEIFIKKIISLKGNFFDFEKFSVYSVAIHDKLEYLERVSKKFKKAGIPSFRLLPLRDKSNCFYKYTKSQKKIIDRVNLSSYKNVKSTFDFKNAINTRGKMCDCGYKYIFLYPDGKAFRCIPSLKNNSGYIGNIFKKDFSLYKRPLVCREKYCYCLSRYTINKFQEMYR